MTLLEVTNRVLRRLRETEVSSTTDNEQSQLVADFVSDIREEMVAIHDWANFYSTAPLVLADGQAFYTIASATELSELVVNEYGGYNVFYFNASSSLAQGQLCVVSPTQMEYIKALRGDQTGQPYYFTWRPVQAAQPNMQVEVFPVPTAAEAGNTIEVEIFSPPQPLEADGTDDATLVAVPARPLVLGALRYALNERGEEIGVAGNLAERRYLDALGAAIEADSKLRRRANRYEMYRD